MLARDSKELSENIKSIQKTYGEAVTYSSMDYIENVTQTLNGQFYLTKTGCIQWLGSNTNLIKDFVFHGTVVDWDVQDIQKNQMYNRFVVPVANYLCKQGYFGIVGIDIILSLVLMDLHHKFLLHLTWLKDMA